MAVLVRPHNSTSARRRIETLLARCEQENGRLLPRPVVLEGDLSQFDLNLDAASVKWISQHCQSVIHNAASLTFCAGSSNGEPMQTNVEGTRRILELCRFTGIRQFHHVSTAYVCGLRQGRVLESELNVGQMLGNDYEKSKVEAEKMVRGADFLDPPTFYRPSIIVGDSQTNYTSTFHSFYAILKLAHTLVSKVFLGSTSASALLAMLDLNGNERKNFVPVDWVSAAISEIFGCPDRHGKTYHLTSKEPTRLADMAEAVQEAVETYSQPADPNDGPVCDGSWFERTFREQMKIYGSYWRDDPDFDTENTEAAVPHLPCPRVDCNMMLRLAKFAIESGFRPPRFQQTEREFDVRHHLQGLFQPCGEMPETPGGQIFLGLQVDGPGGGAWEVAVNNGKPVAAEEGLSSRCTATFHLDSRTCRQLISRQVTVEQAHKQSQVQIEGNGIDLKQLLTILQATVTEPPAGTPRVSSRSGA